MTKSKKPFRYHYDYPVSLEGSLETVFAALTDPDALRTWFAEEVDVQLSPGGSFRFWGRHTYGMPTAAEVDQTVLHVEAPTTLTFSWHFLGQDSTVTWALREPDSGDDAGVRISVTHEFDQLPEGNRQEALLDDLWRIHTGNLCFFLKGERDLFRPDFADPAPVVSCELIINARPERVFAVLTTPEYIKQWFPAPAPFVDPRVGGDYGFGFSFEVDGETINPPPMKILAFEPNRMLSISWPDWRMDPTVPDQTVTWRLEDLDGKTRLTLEHTGFSRFTDVSDYPFGWREFMEKITAVAQATA